jgi:hypothetical protein
MEKRQFLKTMAGGALLLPFPGLALADPQSQEVQRSKVQGEANKLKIRGVPVFKWLVVGVTPFSEVQRELGGMSGISILSQGESAVTRGQLLNFGEKPIRMESGLFGEPGLRLASLGFARGGQRVIEHVEWMVDRGPQQKFVEPMIRRLSTRYQDYASPIKVIDGRGDAEDVYYLWDLGRFVVEAGISDSGSFMNVVFAKRENYKTIRQANGTADLLLPYLSS